MPTPRKYKTAAERQRAYKQRQKAKAVADAAVPAGRGADAVDTTVEDDTTVSPVMQAVLANPSLTVLESIRDNSDALDSDRIRAATEIQKIKALEADKRQGNSDLYELRQIIEALPVGERLAWLKGEVDEHRAAGAYRTPDDTEGDEDQ